MSISTTPPPAPSKKRGLGCLGCGCLILALLVILFVCLVGGIGYWVYTSAVALTSTTSPAIPTFNGSDDLYLSAKQKLADFDHDVENHQAATIRLSADEINTLLAHSPDMIKYNIHAFVTLSNNEARVQAGLPTDVLSHGIIKGRYFTLDASFEVLFDPQTKSVNLSFHTIRVGDETVLGGNSGNSSFNQSFMQGFQQSFTPSFNQSFNQGLRKNPDGAALLDQAKSIEIKDGELVIETQ